MKALRTCAVAMAMMAGSAFAGTADIAICRNPESSLLWKTVASENPSVALSWPEGAVKARLVVTGRNGGTYEITDASAASYVVPMALPTSEADEDVINMTLTYLDSNDVTIAVESAKLGLVCGTVNGASVRFAPEVSASCKTKSLVLMVPDGATAFAVNGDPVDPLSAPDWYKFARSGNYALSLSLAGETLARTVRCGLFGLTLIVK